MLPEVTTQEIGDLMTLEQFIIERQEEHEHSTGSFSRLIRDLSVAAKIVNWHMRRGGINNIFVPIRTNGDSDGDYIVLLDPLDGSSNIEVNVSVGTIFSIYRLPSGWGTPTVGAALQAGLKQIGAGYVVYGSSTILVYTTGHGVNGFTLDPSIGEFVLSHPKIRIPENGKMYSINEGNYNSFEPGLRRYIKWMQMDNPDLELPLSTRYIGSFVADFHRNLLKGGLYMYPSTGDNPEGKLRLMYEANPLAYIAEQAGGGATNGHKRILEISPEKLHQRTPLYIGSKVMLDKAHSFLRGE